MRYQIGKMEVKAKPRRTSNNDMVDEVIARELGCIGDSAFELAKREFNSQLLGLMKWWLQTRK